jgi:hypothetical protein
MEAGTSLFSAELRHVMPELIVGACLLRVVVAKELHHALDFRRQAPTVAFHFFIA